MEQYHDERLERCWDVKTQSLNASSMPTERTITSYRTEEPVSDDVSLDLDDTDDPVARTLDYEGLSA